MKTKFRSSKFVPTSGKGFYSKRRRERMVEEGALSNEEDGFMQGFDNAYEDIFEDYEDSSTW